MNRPVAVGITGGIGAGKSIITKIFQILGVPVYDADSRAKYLMHSHPEVKEQILALFGKESFTDQGINRAFIAKIAFHEPGKIEELNKVVHPAVGEDYKNWCESHKNNTYLIKEAALLFESGSYKSLDKLITVTCPEEIRIKRVLSRDSHRDESDVRAIISKQWAEEKKVEKSDFIIKNDESCLVIPQVLNIHETLIQ